MLRTIAALMLLATTAAAQTQPGDPPAAPAQAAAPTAPADAAATPPASLAAVPTDPMELARHALAQAREAGRCRYAFTQTASGAAQMALSDAAVESVAQFDPRRPLGQRWTLVSATKGERGLRRRFEREDRKGFPTDLMALVAEGEFTFENVAVAEELPDRIVYSFSARVIPERSANETGRRLVEQLVGKVEVSRATGAILRSTLREPQDAAMRALMIVRVHSAMFSRSFTATANGSVLADSSTQMMSMSALLSSTEVQSSLRYTDIQPICDEAEVARIAATEAAAASERK